MTTTERRRSLAIGALSTALLVAAVVLVVLPLRDVEAPMAEVSWWLLVPVFAVAELSAMHVQARRESLSVTFREIALVLGLVFLGPVGLVLAAATGSGLALLHRRQTGLKLFFNLALICFEAALACGVYHVALGGADPGGARGLAAALGTVVLVDLLSAAILSVVVWLKAGEYDDGVLIEAVTSGLVAALANACVGLLVVVLVQTRPVALVLLAGVIVTLVVAYRGYSSLSRGHARLESLYRFTRGLQREDSTAALTESILRQARDVMSAGTAELLVLTGTSPGAGTAARRLTLEDETVQDGPSGAQPWLAATMSGTTVQGTSRTGGSGGSDALAAPLAVDGVVVAVLVVQDRPHHLGGFTADDMLLFESLANHAALSLHRSRLLDQLRQEAEAQEQLSLHDALTGLPNRRHALRSLAAELTGSPRTAVVVLDLDGFTEVNEALGYATGDEVLREAGRRLATFAAEPGHVARLGNDEFVVLLRGVADIADATRRTGRLLAAVNAPVVIDGSTIDVRACAGLTVAPTHGDDAALLLQRADAALYAAKRDRTTLGVWDPSTDGASARRLSLLADLRTAVDAGTLQVAYQPKVDPRTGRTLGAEALVRWPHPVHGSVAPDDFIPLAEHSGLIHLLTDHVLQVALAQCAVWRRDVPDLTVAVNLSTRSLLNPALPVLVGAALRRADLPAAALTLEITETSMMTDVGLALTVLHDLRALGVTLSIDDFGTGQSSLAYLKELPVHEVKVDRSFVRSAVTDAGDAAIVRAAITLGHALALHVVAEGVEDEPTRRLLADWGCDTVQGFHYSRPMTAERFGLWLAAGPVATAPLPAAAMTLAPRAG